MTPTLLEAAWSYIDSSPQWPLFPVSPKTKRPLIKTGRDHAEHASTNPATIERWITRDFPGCGLGMPTGAASGTVVIDADAKHDGERLLAELEAALGCPLPRERMVRTQSGGLHLYFAHPGVMRVRTGQGPRSPLGYLVGAGLDVRADGGIVVLPPTAGYQWIADEDTLPSLPRLWLLAIQGAGEPPPPPRRHYPTSGARRWSDPDRGGPIGQGERNGRLFAIGVAVHVAGATDGELLDHLERVNALRCQPPLPAREVARIATSAARAKGARP